MLPERGTFDLLDVGAGAGFAGEYLRERFPHARYFFIEPLASLETRLEERFGSERNLGRAAGFGNVEYVLLLDVLEHQEDDTSFLRELVDKMRPGAQLIVTVPALRMLWSNWDAILGHFHRYDQASLRCAVGTCPVHIKELSYMFPELVPLGVLRRVMPRDAGGEGSGEFPDLPAAVNGSLYWLGRGSMWLRRFMPFGSSLVMRIEKY